MRIRTAVLCSFAVAATWIGSSAASALEIGPVSVPDQGPPAVNVTLPPTITVGPVSVPVSQVAPGLDATVNVSPQSGFGASISLPSSVGPVPVLPGAPHTVQVGVGPGGAQVAVPAPTPSAPGVPAGTHTPAHGSSTISGATHATGAAVDGVPSSNSAHAATVVPNVATPAGHGSSLTVEQPGVVNASLQHQNPGGVWSLLHDLTSAHGLWIALLLIVAIARFAAGGLLHDAFRRRVHVRA